MDKCCHGFRAGKQLTASCLHYVNFRLNPNSKPVVSNLFNLATPFENMSYARDPIQKYDIVAQPQPLTATLRCSNNNRQDEEHIILHGSLHPLYLHAYASLTAPMLISRTTALAAVQLVLKFVETYWWLLNSCDSKYPVYSLSSVLL